MIFSDIKAQQLGYIITAKQFRGAPKLGYSWYQRAKASDQPFTSSPSLAPCNNGETQENTSIKHVVVLLQGN